MATLATQHTPQENQMIIANTRYLIIRPQPLARRHLLALRASEYSLNGYIFENLVVQWEIFRFDLLRLASKAQHDLSYSMEERQLSSH